MINSRKRRDCIWSRDSLTLPLADGGLCFIVYPASPTPELKFAVSLARFLVGSPEPGTQDPPGNYRIGGTLLRFLIQWWQ